MVLKKLGDELSEELHQVVQYLGQEQSMQVVVEPHEYEKMVFRLLARLHQFVLVSVRLHLLCWKQLYFCTIYLDEFASARQ